MSYFYIIKITGFLSTLSLRRATIVILRKTNTPSQFLSTLSLRRATEQLRQKDIQIAISIHALLAESDISGLWMALNRPLFLSTLSLRRATQLHFPCTELYQHFYPRSPCGERLWANFSGFYWWVISIHALLAESDHDLRNISHFFKPFLSTLSLRRATCLPGFCRMTAEFLSTLSLRRAT